MNLQRFVNDMHAANVVETLLTMAGTDYKMGLVDLVADSEEQRWFGADVRIRALASIWEQFEASWQTTESAQAVLRAANRYTNAQWWIKRESHTLVSFTDLDEDIEQELSQQS